MKRAIVLFLFLLASGVRAEANATDDFIPVIDSVSVLMQERTGVKTELKLKKVLRRKDVIDLYFDKSLTDYPWTKEDINFARKTLKDLFPDKYRGRKLGGLYSNGTKLENVLVKPHYPELSKTPFIRREGERKYAKGLSGRNITLWQSHGLYFNENTGRWTWQRAPLFRTVEDLYTQSYVLPFLIPMLENAGAYVLTPRERDTQANEIICDNDPQFEGPRPFPMRQQGYFSTSGNWQSTGGKGFADKKAAYLIDENPFTMGTALKIAQTRSSSNPGTAEWKALFDSPGRYAVYISYPSLSESTSQARYTVRHAGGESVFIVNQRMGGGTWIYLGSFDFDKEGFVILDNVCPDSKTYVSGRCVSADGVRFGGGMGKIARSSSPEKETSTSNMPAYTEGALYNLMWSGFGTDVTDKDGEWETEYVRDYSCRGEWAAELSRRRHIPIDLSLAFHSDAGTTSCDSTVGTLAIYCYKNEGSTTYANGRNRITGRQLALSVQDNVTRDIRALYDTAWNRRQIWDRNYSEARRPQSPAMILESLSHANFADMKLGHDPMFRFDLSRAVYKGILKYLSELYQRPYTVQPLPVHALGVSLTDKGSAILSWKETPDPLEESASANGFILYTRTANGAFDNGREITNASINDGLWTVEVPLSEGVLTSFKIAAFNDGGRSLPSEVVCVGRSGPDKVMVVNNFDRVAAPSWFDTPTYAGFDAKMDSGIGWGDDLSYIGEDYEHRRDRQWISDSNPGFGASHTSSAGLIIPGNSFDNILAHADALMGLGYSVISASREAWESAPSMSEGCIAVDLICGKQVSTIRGRVGSKVLYSVWPRRLRAAIENYTSEGGNMIVSGADIATDVFESVYPCCPDSLYRSEARAFIENVLGFTGKHFFERNACVSPSWGAKVKFKEVDFPVNYNNILGGRPYCVENADALDTFGNQSYGILKYGSLDGYSAIACDKKYYRCISFGFPLETVTSSEDLRGLLKGCLDWFKE